jgi:hypothetical protein
MTRAWVGRRRCAMNAYQQRRYAADAEPGRRQIVSDASLRVFAGFPARSRPCQGCEQGRQVRTRLGLLGGHAHGLDEHLADLVSAWGDDGARRDRVDPNPAGRKLVQGAILGGRQNQRSGRLLSGSRRPHRATVGRPRSCGLRGRARHVGAVERCECAGSSSTRSLQRSAHRRDMTRRGHDARTSMVAQRPQKRDRSALPAVPLRSPVPGTPGNRRELPTTRPSVCAEIPVCSRLCSDNGRIGETG